MDLTTTPYVLAILTELSATEIAALPNQISACSALIQRWCNRPLTLQTGLDEVYTSRCGEDVILRTYPVVGISSVAVAPNPVLTITRTGAATGATVEVPSTTPPGPSGSTLILRAKRLGAWTSSTIEFAALADQTVAALAAAVNGVVGWVAEVTDPDYGAWGVDDIVGGGGPIAALGDGADLQAFTQFPRYQVDRTNGTLRVLEDAVSNPFTSSRFGPAGGLFEDEDETGFSAVRIRYDAGYNPVPLDIQNACTELVKATLDRMSVSSVLQSERTASWSWTARQFGELIGGMPDSVRQVIASYRDHAR